MVAYVRLMPRLVAANRAPPAPRVAGGVRLRKPDCAAGNPRGSEGRRQSQGYAEGTSVFTIVSIDGDEALIESVLSAPGTYPFHCKLECLVPVES